MTIRIYGNKFRLLIAPPTIDLRFDLKILHSKSQVATASVNLAVNSAVLYGESTDHVLKLGVRLIRPNAAIAGTSFGSTAEPTSLH